MSNSKDRLIDNYKKCLRQMTSDSDFQRYFGPECASRVIKYSQLNDYDNIEQLLPNNKDYVIILTEYKRSEGHWCLLYRKDDTLEWFDSYGGKSGKPDGEFSFISKAMQVFLNEDCRCLSKLLKKSDMNVIYNKAKLQSCTPIQAILIPYIIVFKISPIFSSGNPIIKFILIVWPIFNAVCTLSVSLFNFNSYI